MAIRVNGREIPNEAVEYEFKRLVKFYEEHMSPQEVRKQTDLLQKKAREQAIGARLLIEAAALLDIKTPPGDVEARLEKMIAKCGGREKFDTLLKKQNLTEESVRQSIEQGRRVDLLVERVTGETREPTEDELRRHYEEHSGEYMRPVQAQVQHILIKPSSDSREDRAVTRSRLLEIRRKIEEGAAFADQAAAHSECPSGRRTGGSLGWVVQGTTVPEFDNAVFSMKIGELSDVVETRLGMHIIRKSDEEESRPAPLDEVREKIRDFLRHSRRGELLAAYVAELRTKAVIED